MWILEDDCHHEVAATILVTLVMCVFGKQQGINTPGCLMLISLVSLCICNPSPFKKIKLDNLRHQFIFS